MPLQNRFAQFARRPGVPAKGESNGPHGRCRHRQGQCALAVDAADQQRRRAAERRQRNLAKRRAPPQGRERNVDLPQQIARREHVALVAGDEIDGGNSSARRHRPARSCRHRLAPQVSEIIGPAGSDMQMLPPTVAVFQILKEARKARQHWLISGEAASHSGGHASASSWATVQVAAI